MTDGRIWDTGEDKAMTTPEEIAREIVNKWWGLPDYIKTPPPEYERLVGAIAAAIAASEQEIAFVKRTMQDAMERALAASEQRGKGFDEMFARFVGLTQVRILPWPNNPMDQDVALVAFSLDKFRDTIDSLATQLQASEQRVRELEHENAIFREDAIPAVRRAEAQFQRAEASERALERVIAMYHECDHGDLYDNGKNCPECAALASPGSPQE